MNEQERAEKIEYISGAIREGYEPMFKSHPPN